MIVALIGAFSGEAYANNHSDCACCTANKCHSNAKCHDSAKVCVCSHQAAQVSLPRNNTLPVLVLSGFLAPNSGFTYLYLSVKDVFHPPKA